VSSKAQDEVVTKLLDSAKYVNGLVVLWLALVHPEILRHSAQHLDVVRVVECAAHVLYRVNVTLFNCLDQYVRIGQVLNVGVHFVQ